MRCGGGRSVTAHAWGGLHATCRGERSKGSACHARDVGTLALRLWASVRPFLGFFRFLHAVGQSRRHARAARWSIAWDRTGQKY